MILNLAGGNRYVLPPHILEKRERNGADGSGLADTGDDDLADGGG